MTHKTPFFQALKHNLEDAMRIYSRSEIDIHAENELAFRYACNNGHLDIIKWIYSLSEIDIHADNDHAFECACGNGYLGIAQWLYSLGNVDIHTHDEVSFKRACMDGHLDVAQWLYSLDHVDISAGGECAFRYACINGHLSTAQWIYSVHKINLHVWYGYFKDVQENNLDMLQFLLEIGLHLYLCKDLLLAFSSWSDKFAVHQLLLQYCKEEDICYLDADVVRALLSATKSARKR